MTYFLNFVPLQGNEELFYKNKLQIDTEYEKLCTLEISLEEENRRLKTEEETEEESFSNPLSMKRL